MSAMTFTNLINKGLDLYREGKYWEAYLLMTGHADHEPRNEATVYDFRASLACRAGRVDLGRQLLEEAVFQKGCWYTQQYLQGDDDIRPATQLPGFERILEVCAQREKEAQAQARSELNIVRGKGKREGKPLIVMLHGNGQNVPIAREDWSAAIEAGYDMAFVQSSQLIYQDAYRWDNIEQGVRDLKAAFASLRESGELDGRDVILAGFSAGGRLALHALLNNLVEAKGAVLVGPWLPEIEEWLPKVAALRGKGIFTLVGDQDAECLPGAKRLADVLDRDQTVNLLHISKGIGHDYPEDFADLLPIAVKTALSRV